MNLLPRLGRLVRAALLLGAAATPALAQNPPGGYIDPSTAKRGGDGVGGIEKSGGKAPKPTSPGNGGGPVTTAGQAGLPSPSEGWNDMGGELPGGDTPVLAGNGDGSAGSSLGLELSAARPSSPTTLVVGTDAAFQPFKGGVLVPTPQLMLPGLLTDELGTLRLETVLPFALPTGATLVFQLWIQDPDAPQGHAASNGQLLLVP